MSSSTAATRKVYSLLSKALTRQDQTSKPRGQHFLQKPSKKRSFARVCAARGLSLAYQRSGIDITYQSQPLNPALQRQRLCDLWINKKGFWAWSFLTPLKWSENQH